MDSVFYFFYNCFVLFSSYVGYFLEYFYFSVLGLLEFEFFRLYEGLILFVEGSSFSIMLVIGVGVWCTLLCLFFSLVLSVVFLVYNILCIGSKIVFSNLGGSSSGLSVFMFRVPTLVLGWVGYVSKSLGISTVVSSYFLFFVVICIIWFLFRLFSMFFGFSVVGSGIFLLLCFVLVFNFVVFNFLSFWGKNLFLFCSFISITLFLLACFDLVSLILLSVCVKASSVKVSFLISASTLSYINISYIFVDVVLLLFIVLVFISINNPVGWFFDNSSMSKEENNIYNDVWNFNVSQCSSSNLSHLMFSSSVNNFFPDWEESGEGEDLGDLNEEDVVEVGESKFDSCFNRLVLRNVSDPSFPSFSIVNMWGDSFEENFESSQVYLCNSVGLFLGESLHLGFFDLDWDDGVLYHPFYGSLFELQKFLVDFSSFGGDFLPELNDSSSISPCNVCNISEFLSTELICSSVLFDDFEWLGFYNKSLVCV